MANHVTYESAMVNLRSMFGDTDPDLIAMILQQNRGHLERTVEQLLGLTGGAPSNTLSVPVSSGNSRRRSSGADTTPTVGGSNLPDDFLRAPSFFEARYGSGSASRGNQIDQDAILAQMLQDEMFMAEIQANPELYYEEAQHVLQQPSQQAAASSAISSSSSTSSYIPPGQSHPAYQSVVHSGRGDFSGMGTSAGGAVSSQSQSFKDRWNGLTAAAKKRLLTVANKMKSTNETNKGKDYQVHSKDLQSGLLSDSESLAPIPIDDDNNLLGKTKSSDAIGERDIEISTREIDEGVYVNNNNTDDAEDLSEGGSARNQGYVPPSMTTSLNAGATKRWGRKSSSED